MISIYIDLFSISSNHIAEQFFTLVCSYGFLPIISKTTRHTDVSDTLIDNIFCNNLKVISSSGIIIEDISDHYPIFAASSLGSETIQHTKQIKQTVCFDYRKIEDMKTFLGEALHGIENENDPEVIAEKVIGAYNKGISKFSFVLRGNRKTISRKPWITPALLCSINRKNELFLKRTKDPTPENIATFQAYRNILNTLLKNSKKQYFTAKFSEHSGNTKQTWKYIKQLMGRKDGKDDSPDHIVDPDGKLIASPSEQAELFNEFFAEVGTKLKNKIQQVNSDPLELITLVEDNMSLDPTCIAELTDVIKNLNKVGAGYDRINSRLFNATYEHILDVLLHLFNACLSAGVFPSVFKVAVIRPVFKGGNPKEMNNYRPISLLPVISKILEQLISNRLQFHLAQNSVIHPNQFAFQKKT